MKFKSQKEILNSLSSVSKYGGLEIDISHLKTRHMVESLIDRDLVFVKGYKESVFDPTIWYVYLKEK